jgi:membrane protease YdiL (CAAX protease family)
MTDEPVARGSRTADLALAVAASVVGTLAVGSVLRAAGSHPSRPIAAIASEVVPAASVAILVTRWRWWRRVGWRSPKALWLLWFPLLLLAVSDSATSQRHMTPSHLTAGVAAVLVVGFTEEMWFRGVVVELLAPRGAVAATFGSAVLFGALHVLNTLGGLSASAALLQAIQAFAIGIVFAAARVRMRALWPLILVHAAVDLPFILRFGGTALRPMTPELARSAFLLLIACCVYAIVVIRPSKTRQVIAGQPAISSSRG